MFGWRVKKIFICALAAVFALSGAAEALCATLEANDAQSMFAQMQEQTIEDTYSSSAYLPVYTKVDTDEKLIAITVDDCYQIKTLQVMIDLALKHDGKLTIFPIGEAAAQSGMVPVLREAVFEHGFEIGNHTWSHQRIFRLSEEEMASEIWRQQDQINQLLGVNYHQSFFRLMGGDGEYDQRTHNYLKQLGFRGVAHWTLSGSDASLESIKKSLCPGAIYLFHTTSSDLEKLRSFIPYATSRGYRLVTLTELCGMDDNSWSDISTALTSMPEPADYAVEYREQAKGDYSWSIVKIQERLAELGYLGKNSKSALKGTPADGVFGDSTQAAVRAFQRDVGLEATGIADVRTQEALFGGIRGEQD